MSKYTRTNSDGAGFKPLTLQLPENWLYLQSCRKAIGVILLISIHVALPVLKETHRTASNPLSKFSTSQSKYMLMCNQMLLCSAPVKSWLSNTWTTPPLRPAWASLSVERGRRSKRLKPQPNELNQVIFTLWLIVVYPLYPVHVRSFSVRVCVCVWRR